MPTTNTPKELDIVQRHMGFQFPKNVPRYWAAGDPFETQLFNALSLTFPKGERMFIDSVRNFRDRIDDAALIDDVRAFIGQETQHGKEHEAFNDWIASQGYPVERIYAYIDERQALAATAPEIVRLAITCALEHFTAIMADAVLSDDELVASMDESVRALWVWHAIEETEHKAVAFDVFQHVGGDHRTRTVAMAYITYHFIRNISQFHVELMKHDGQLTNVGTWARGIYRFWGPRGRFTKLIPAYLAYYRKDFHPWQQDNRARVERWKAWIDAQAKRTIHQNRGAAVDRAA